jgi:cell division protein FtsI (penicillin-binding protein 3)
LRFKRRHWILLILLFLLVGALFGFSRRQLQLPEYPKMAPPPPPRGSILAADGTILAVGPADHRRYPQGVLAAHLVGFSGAEQPDGRYGLEGLEYTLDARLQAGQDIHLTLDPTLQAAAQDELAEAVTSQRAEGGAAVILQAGTGDILAATSYPFYDPNKQAKVSDRSIIANRAFLQQAEPGSTMKPFVVAGLLASGRLSPDEVLDLPKSITVGDNTFHDVDRHDPILSVTDILRYSSNVGMIELSKRFTPQEEHDWLARFGFGQSVDLPEMFTRSGQLNPAADWVPQDQASVTIGQSVSTTALQLALAYSVIANDGVYVPPKLVQNAPHNSPHRVMPASVARIVRSMLTQVVANGEAHLGKVPGMPTAGKTGTANLYSAATGGYVPGEYTAWFAGMFPARKPRLIMVVFVRNPQKEIYGALVSAPVFRAIGSEAVAQWDDLPPQTRAAGGD